MFYCRIYVGLLILVFLKSICNGRDVAHDLTKRYNDDRMKCEKDGKTKPAFQCSGIIMRGVRDVHTNDLQYAWHFKQLNKAKTSFSTTFLRKDTRFISFPFSYNSGFIIYPHLKTPKRKNKYKVYCAFPQNGGTDGRAGHGCGGTVAHCDKQGIDSFSKWLSHFQSQTTTPCSFDMTIESAAADFATVIKAITYIRKHSPTLAYGHNELLFHSWREDKPKNIPIEAFFYILDTPDGYRKAATHQDDFYKEAGEKVPIVGIRLPTKTNPEIYIKNKHRKPKKN